jgi:Tfp pilus assembly PilM family ATPase
MPRLLAVEWDLREARVAVGRTRGEGLAVEHAFAVDLGPRDPGQTFADVNVGQKVASALAARNVGRAETLVAVGRASIELRQLTLPPSPLEELPDLVRFQALREFTTIGEDWPLDFVHLDTSEDHTLNVLAAAISPDMVGQIQETCRAAELLPKRLVLRPFAAASLLRRRDGSSSQPCRLMVDLLADEADLTILVDGAVVLMRTVRLTEDLAVQSRALLGEIRRTIASAQNQLRGQRVQKVILCGDGSDQSSLKQTIETELSLDVELFDPFSNLQLEGDLRSARPEHAGRFAPLLGMLTDEAAEARHAIDFLDPRKRPEAPHQTRRNVLIAATIAAVLFAAGIGVWMLLSNLDKRVAGQELKSQELQQDLKGANTSLEHAKAVEAFLASDFTWLDELYDLSEQLPPPEDVLVTQLNFGKRPAGGGQITVTGYTQEDQQISDLRKALRTEGRKLESAGERYNTQRKEYRWQFKEAVLIDPGTQAKPKPVKPKSAKPGDETEPQTAAAENSEKESQAR